MTTDDATMTTATLAHIRERAKKQFFVLLPGFATTGGFILCMATLPLFWVAGVLGWRL